MRNLMAICLLVTFFVACSSPSDSPPAQSAAPAGGRSDTYFQASGDVEVNVDDAEATLFKNRANIVTLNIVSTTAAIRKMGRSYAANLFFSRQFEPKAGQVPHRVRISQ